MASVTIDNLAAEITLAVQEYTDDVSVAIEHEVDTTAKAVVDELKDKSPKDSGEYAKGWASKKDTKGGEYKQIVHNKKKPALAHLLEFGHVKVNGGWVDGKPHIRPAYDKHIAGMDARIKKIIKDGGKR